MPTNRRRRTGRGSIHELLVESNPKAAKAFNPKENMLRSIKDLETYSVRAKDGSIGTAKDFYFDDVDWVVRYLVIETDWEARRVLISPISMGRQGWAERTLAVSLTRQQIQESPDIDTDKPVSRQQEMGYLGYYGYGAYWGGGGLWGAGIYPDTLQSGLSAQASLVHESHQRDDTHLRSGNAVMRYYVHALDGDIGHVEGILVNEESWAIQYVIVNTSNWWLGHKVVIAPQWIDHVSWAESTIYLDLTREAVSKSPPYDPNVLLDAEQEAKLHTHYGRKPHLTLE